MPRIQCNNSRCPHAYHLDQACPSGTSSQAKGPTASVVPPPAAEAEVQSWDLAVLGDRSHPEHAGSLWGLLGGTETDALRFKGAQVERSGDDLCISLYARNGGGNRECTCGDYDNEECSGRNCTNCTGCCGETATNHPLYLTDADDPEDWTYRTFYYALPAELDEETRDALRSASRESDPDDADWVGSMRFREEYEASLNK